MPESRSISEQHLHRGRKALFFQSLSRTIKPAFFFLSFLGLLRGTFPSSSALYSPAGVFPPACPNFLQIFSLLCLFSFFCIGNFKIRCYISTKLAIGYLFYEKEKSFASAPVFHTMGNGARRHDRLRRLPRIPCGFRRTAAGENRRSSRPGTGCSGTGKSGEKGGKIRQRARIAQRIQIGRAYV